MEFPLYQQTRFDVRDSVERKTFILAHLNAAAVPANTMTGDVIGQASVGVGVKLVGHVSMPDDWHCSVGADGEMTINGDRRYAANDLVKELGGVMTGGGDRPIVIRVPKHKQ